MSLPPVRLWSGQTLHKRFVTYNKDTMPMVEHLEKMDLLKRVDAKRTIEEVYVVSGKVVGATSF